MFLVGNIMLAAVLIPTLRDADAAIPMWTSLPTAAVLYLYGVTFLTLELYLSGASVFATAIIWTMIALFRNEQENGIRGILQR